MVASTERPCAFCRAPVEGRKQEACSDRCRTALSRRRKAEAQRKRDAETLTVVYRGQRLGLDAQALLTKLLAVVGEFERLGGLLKTRLERT